MTSPNKVDAVVIGGGPAGSTVATLLAKQGLQVALFERRRFPRFHIGESLLPASLPIFEELGVLEEITTRFIKKPGGKWYYGNRPVFSDFSAGPGGTSFDRTPHAYMVRRADFDDILLKNAARSGAQVLQGYSVVDLLQNGDRVIGVVVRDSTGASHEYHSDMVFDCSGFGAVIPKKFNLRKQNRLERMAVFGHYRTIPLNDDIKNGWFVGQMVYNGWIWLIPLKPDLISIGVVIPVDDYKKAQESPQAFLERYMATTPIVPPSISPNPQLEGKVHIYGNLGYTSSRAYGNGWVLVGDAAFFIDPCYSSGVHLALSMAKEAANLFLKSRRTGKNQTELFAQYEKTLRRDEKLVLRFVDAFYMASRNRVLKWLVPVTTTKRVNRSFVAVTGGDFATRPWMINMVYFMSRIVSVLFPVRARA
jgi:flavin-dependent dehydrogenase